MLVVQLQGAKDWTVCVPRVGKAEGFNTAQRSQYQEVLRRRKQGCTSYTDSDLGRLDCSKLTLSAGDVFYMPKGVVHYALTSDAGSAHLTVSLNRDGVAWGDLLLAQLDGMDTAAQPTTLLQLRSLLRQQIYAVTTGAQGLDLLEALPMHDVRPTAKPEAGQRILHDAKQLWAKVIDAVLQLDRAQLAVLAPGTTFMSTEDLRRLLLSVVDNAAGDVETLSRLLEQLTRKGRFAQDITRNAASQKAQQPRQRSRLGSLDNHPMSAWPEFLPLVRDRRSDTCTNCICKTGCDGSCQLTRDCDDDCSSNCKSGCTGGCTGIGRCRVGDTPHIHMPPVPIFLITSLRAQPG